MDVSLLLPCFNAEATLPQTLQDIYQQTLSDFEIVAVNDGSTDRTLAILKEWSSRDSRLRVINRAHGGVVAACNAGLEACRGKWVARMDADDRCHPERLELQAQFLSTHPEIDVVGSFVKGFPEKEIGRGFELYYQWLNSLVTPRDIAREMFIESPIANPSAAFRKQVVLQAGGYRDYGWPEDYDLWLRLHLNGSRFAKIPRILLEWREHPERLTHTHSRYSVKNFLRAKAHYLARGPLSGRDAVLIWGAGMTGRRLSKHLVREGVPVAGYIDVDPQKIGGTLRGKPIFSKDELQKVWADYNHPLLLTAVRARKARPLIRAALQELGFKEGNHWLAAA